MLPGPEKALPPLPAEVGKMLRRREHLHVPLVQPGVHVLLEPDGLSGQELDERWSGLEFASGYASLANNGLQRSYTELRVIGYWHCYCRVRKFFLHDDVAAPLPHFYQPMARQDGTDFLPGKDTQPTQPPHPRG